MEAVGIWEDSIFLETQNYSEKYLHFHKHTQNEIEIGNYAKQTRLICLMLILPRYVLCCWKPTY